MLPVNVTCQCSLSISLINVTRQCRLSMSPVNVTCQCHLSILPVNVAYQCRLSISPINIACRCRLSISPVNIACKCRLEMSPVNVAYQCQCQSKGRLTAITFTPGSIRPVPSLWHQSPSHSVVVHLKGQRSFLLRRGHECKLVSALKTKGQADR